MTNVKRRIGDLRPLPEEIYPRLKVDSSHWHEMARALEAGIELPKMVIDKDGRIVDGMHRWKAYHNVYGADHEVVCDQRAFTSELELEKAAASLNTGHGKPLTQQDRQKVALFLRDKGMEVHMIAVTLRTSAPQVDKLLTRIVEVHDNGDVEDQPGKPISYGRSLSKAQYEVTKSSSGWRSRQTVGQLIRELEGDVLDLEDASLVEALHRLAALIQRKVPPAA